MLDLGARRLSGREREQLRSLAAWVELECAVVQATLAAQDAERTKKDFVAMVSHELRTPLTSVRGSLELLASGRFGELSGQAERLVGIAVTSTDRLVRLADDVLDLSRLRSGRLRLRVGEVDLAEVVDHALHAVADAAGRAGVPVASGCGAVAVRGDADRLVQVVTNLLANAVKASPPGAPVEVGCERGGLTARLRVVDHGPGVPPDQVERIFEPFAQVESGTGRAGAGLGLAITRGIVEAHGGEVGVAPTPGGGSTFAVSLPVAGPGADQPWW